MKRKMSLALVVILLLTLLVGCQSDAPKAEEKESEAVTENTTETTTADWNNSADVVVIGAGGAGLAAAVEAADSGAKKVIILEKMGAIGGTTFISQGLIGGCNSKISKAAEIEHTPDDLYNLVMANSEYVLDPELIRITVDKSGETIDWLSDRVKVEFDDEVYQGYGPLYMMHRVSEGGLGFKEPFEAALEEMNIELLLKTEAKDLFTNDNGVYGVKAEKDGEEYLIEAKAVVIATGGYAGNAELAKALYPPYEGIYGIGLPSCTGDGLIMASNHGAAISSENVLMAVVKDYEIMEEHNGNTITASLGSFLKPANLIFVGEDGNRFMNEKDGGFMSQKINLPILNQMHKDGSPGVWAIIDHQSLEEYEVKRGLDLEYVSADTPAALAEAIGVNAENLEKTFEDFNAAVDKGFDDEFGRRGEDNLAKLEVGPYYAVRIVPCHIITYGGILRDADAQVLRADLTPIPGLYTAGEASCNSAYMGFTLTNAFTWGRIAGHNAAEFTK